MATATSLLRTTLPRLARPQTSLLRVQQYRSLNSATAPVLFTANATCKGARAGTVNAGSALSVSLGPPGTPKKTNPEELFAAGYGACFQSALNAVAGKQGVKMPKNPEDSVVESEVELVGSMEELDFGLRVKMTVKVRGMGLEQVKGLVEETKKTCPYSRATKGNVETTVVVEELK